MHGWIYGAFVKATASLSVMLLRWIYLIDWDQRTVRKCVINLSKMSAGESCDASDTIRTPWDKYKEPLIVQESEFVLSFVCYIDLRADLMVHQSLQELIWPLYYDLSTERWRSRPKEVKET